MIFGMRDSGSSGKSKERNRLEAQVKKVVRSRTESESG